MPPPITTSLHFLDEDFESPPRCSKKARLSIAPSAAPESSMRLPARVPQLHGTHISRSRSTRQALPPTSAQVQTPAPTSDRQSEHIFQKHGAASESVTSSSRSLRARSKKPLYDMKLHPMDEFMRPAYAARRHTCTAARNVSPSSSVALDDPDSDIVHHGDDLTQKTDYGNDASFVDTLLEIGKLPESQLDLEAVVERLSPQVEEQLLCLLQSRRNERQRPALVSTSNAPIDEMQPPTSGQKNASASTISSKTLSADVSVLFDTDKHGPDMYTSSDEFSDQSYQFDYDPEIPESDLGEMNFAEPPV